MLCYKCQKEIPDNSLVCSWCGAEMSDAARRSGGFSAMGVQFLPMNWFKFLIYFVLFFEAVQYVFTGIMYITGYVAKLSLGGEGYVVYHISEYGRGYAWIDVLYGFLCLSLAVFAIFARFRLAKFRKNAMWVYIAYLMASGLIGTLYGAVYLIVAGAAPRFIFAGITELIPQALLAYLNYIYFMKRKHLFRG